MIGEWSLAQLQTEFGGEVTTDAHFTGCLQIRERCKPGSCLSL